MTDHENRGEQIERLKRELAELRPPLDDQQLNRLFDILEEMDELRQWLEASERAARLPPEPIDLPH